MEGKYHWPRLVRQQDLLEPTIEESGNGEGELGTLNGWRHYLDDGCCVEQARKWHNPRGREDLVFIYDTGGTWPLP